MSKNNEEKSTDRSSRIKLSTNKVKAAIEKSNAENYSRMIKHRSNNKEQNERNKQRMEVERKKKEHKNKVKKTAILSVLVLFGLTVFFTRTLWLPKLQAFLDKPHATILNDGKIEKGNFPIALENSSDNALVRINNELVKADDTNIVFYNENGETEKTYEHNYATPIIRKCGSRLLVFDLGGNNLQVLSRKNKIFDKKFENPIFMAEIASNSNVAVVTSSEQYAGTVNVYNDEGAEIYNWSSGGKIVDITFTPEGDGCYITTMESNAGEMQSTVHKVNFNSTEDVMTSKSLSTLVLDVCETSTGDVWVVGDTKFFKLDKSGNILLQYDYTGDMISFDVCEDSAFVAIKGVNRGMGDVASFKADSDSKTADQIIRAKSGQIKKIKCEGKHVIILGSSSIDSYDVSGNLLSTANLSADYSDFVFIDDCIYFLDYHEINKIKFKM